MEKRSVRDRIIETAASLFYKNGYNQTGINQIIEEASVAKASLYQHFRSKQDIAVAYLNRRHYWWMGELTDYVSAKEGAKEKILGSFDFLSKWLQESKFRGCGFQNIITDLPDGHSKIKEETLFHKNELFRWIQRVLEEGSDDSSENIISLAQQVLVLIDGAIIMSQIQNDDWPIKSAKIACKKILS
jgi:AcrR family transcriptional regulator